VFGFATFERLVVQRSDCSNYERSNQISKKQAQSEKGNGGAATISQQKSAAYEYSRISITIDSFSDES